MFDSVAIFAMVWQPMGPPLQIVAGAVVLAALAVFAYLRSSGSLATCAALLAMRLALVAGVTLLLFGPSRIPPQSQQVGRPKLSILVDTSESMLTTDCQGLSRLRFAEQHWLSSDKLAVLRAEFDIELNGFDSSVRPLAEAALRGPDKDIATGRVTHLAESVAAGLAKLPARLPGEALLVISDGHDSEGAPIQAAAALAESKKIPVYSVALGGNSMERDLAVLAIPMQEYLLPNEPGAILVKAYQVGFDQKTTTVRLRHGEEQQLVPIAFNHQRVVEVQLPIKQAESGAYEYTVSVDPIEGEAEPKNNSQSVFCEVQKKRLKILALEGQPFWDSKFLAQSLRKDERIELTQITQVSRDKRETIITRVDGAKPAFPTTAENWAQYDVVILGQGMERMFDEHTGALLADFVSNHGGHVIFCRGPAYDRTTPEGQSIGASLAAIEPMIWSDDIARDTPLLLTPAGETSQWFSRSKMGIDAQEAFRRLPGFSVMQISEREKPATLVLARAASEAGGGNGDGLGSPALVTMSYGRGTVVALAGEGLWRWSLLAPENQDLVGFYDTFWSNLVRWLTMGGDFQPGQQVSLHLSRTSARLGDPLDAEVVFKHAPPGGARPKLELIDADGSRSEVPLEPIPGRDPRYRGALKPKTAGVHQIVLQTPGMTPESQDRKFNVYDVNEERLQTAANPMPLRVLAEHSGGVFFQPDEADQLAACLRQHRASLLVPPQLEYIWDEWTIMVTLLVWAGAEWLLRRRAGLL